MKMLLRYAVVVVLVALVLGTVGARFLGVNVAGGPFRTAQTSVDARRLASRIRLPDGFAMSVYAADLPGVRVMHFTDTGDLLVSLPVSGRIVWLRKDDDGDGHPDARSDLLTGLNRPHGLDLHDGWLYVAETDAIGRIRFDAKERRLKGTFERFISLPGGGNHWSRTIRFGPDGWLYVTVGSDCNVCEEQDKRRAAMLRFPSPGGEGELYATGLRNTVAFDWRPGTDELYGVDNGRDWLGDDFPPCELNRIERGKFYGWPYANGNRVPDPDIGRGHADEIEASITPVHAFGAHTAPLGIVFLRSPKWRAEYRDAALVALHGSWNRSRKQGYEVVSLHFHRDGTISERPFVTGFEKDEDVIGRPVDVIEGPDGAVYVSDDYAGAVYRISDRSVP